MLKVRKKRVLIPGRVLVGFNELFDASYGDPNTPKPYPKVTPSSVGGVLLPFPCPHCGVARPQTVDRKTRLGYYDVDREFSWCPHCRGRYVINPKGQPLEKPLPKDAQHAPALVEYGEKQKLIGVVGKDGLDVLGVG